MNSPSFDTSEYTKNAGLYVHAKLPAEFGLLLNQLCEDLGLPEADLEELHCTLMYSRDAVPDSMPIIRPVHNALIPSVQHWKGHDDQIYVVADVHSMSLIQAHATLARAGAEHSFASFSPHVTLGKLETVPDDFDERVEKVNRSLKPNPLHVVFMGVKAADCKQGF